MLKPLLITLACLVGVAITWLAWPKPTDGMARYPHAFLAQAGYDPGQIQVVLAPIQAPPAPPAGTQTAWICIDPTFNDSVGRPWLFPMTAPADGRPEVPVHPERKVAPKLERCTTYRTREAQAMLDAWKGTP